MLMVCRVSRVLFASAAPLSQQVSNTTTSTSRSSLSPPSDTNSAINGSGIHGATHSSLLSPSPLPPLPRSHHIVGNNFGNANDSGSSSQSAIRLDIDEGHITNHNNGDEQALHNNKNNDKQHEQQQQRHERRSNGDDGITDASIEALRDANIQVAELTTGIQGLRAKAEWMSHMVTSMQSSDTSIDTILTTPFLSSPSSSISNGSGASSRSSSPLLQLQQLSRSPSPYHRRSLSSSLNNDRHMDTATVVSKSLHALPTTPMIPRHPSPSLSSMSSSSVINVSTSSSTSSTATVSTATVGRNRPIPPNERLIQRRPRSDSLSTPLSLHVSTNAYELSQSW
jgi:hypothetical protein